MTAKTSIAQAKIGIFIRVMPGALVFSTPTMISIAPAIAEISMKPIPSSQKSALSPGEYSVSVSGGYMNQPPFGARSKKMLEKKNRPPMRYAQKAKAPKRGNGRSRAASICGNRSTPRASTIGTANRNIMVVPWTVKAWL
jgi:hypothetical protein